MLPTIRWFLRQNGDSYSDYERVSVMTDLLQCSAGMSQRMAVARRYRGAGTSVHRSVGAIYTSTNQEEVKTAGKISGQVYFVWALERTGKNMRGTERIHAAVAGKYHCIFRRTKPDFMCCRLHFQAVGYKRYVIRGNTRQGMNQRMRRKGTDNLC